MKKQTKKEITNKINACKINKILSETMTQFAREKHRDYRTLVNSLDKETITKALLKTINIHVKGINAMTNACKHSDEDRAILIDRVAELEEQIKVLKHKCRKPYSPRSKATVKKPQGKLKKSK